MEYAFDGNPLSSESQSKIVGKLTTIISGGSPEQVMTLTIPVLGTSSTPAFSGTGELTATSNGVTYWVQAGGNLSSWPAQVSEVPQAQAAAVQGGLDLPALSTGWSYKSQRRGRRLSCGWRWSDGHLWKAR